MIEDPRKWSIRGHWAVATITIALVLGILIGVVIANPLSAELSSTDENISQCQKPADPDSSVEPLRLQVVNGRNSSGIADSVTVEIFTLNGTQYCQRDIRIPDDSRVVPLVWERGEYHIIVRSDERRASTDIRKVSSRETLESLVVSDRLFSMGEVQRMNRSS